MTRIRPSATRGPVLPDVEAAYAALAAGVGFLVERGTRSPSPVSNPRVALRRGGNCLKELDRFLALLIDACVPSAAVAALASLSRGGDVAGWLGCNGFASAMPRLRAIARVRERACGDQVMGFGSWSKHDLAIATMGACGSADPYPQISNRALAAIAEFYLSIGDGLRRHHGGCAAQP
jgi:hypothetical protein